MPSPVASRKPGDPDRGVIVTAVRWSDAACVVGPPQVPGRSLATAADALHDLGVRTVVIPSKGKPGKARQVEEHRSTFRRTVKWRTGCEGRISTLKRSYGWDRAHIDSVEGACIWAGHGVLTHNLIKISAHAG